MPVVLNLNNQNQANKIFACLKMDGLSNRIINIGHSYVGKVSNLRIRIRQNKIYICFKMDRLSKQIINIGHSYVGGFKSV